MEKLTPMMEAYLKTKEEYKDSILFYRLGDFYEMFFEDAKLVSSELDLVLTGKSCGLPERAPMCGVPFHAADSYIQKLVERGYKVAICEQVEDPKLAKGLVKREVIRIVTPGTRVDEKTDEAVFISCIFVNGEEFSLATAELSTGEFNVRHFINMEGLKDALIKTAPREVICHESFLLMADEIRPYLPTGTGIFPLNNPIKESKEAADLINKYFGVSLNHELNLLAAANLYNYLLYTQKQDLSHITAINDTIDEDCLIIDPFTYRNLELIDSLRREDSKGTLFSILDKTKTSMGRRLLKQNIKYPLKDIKQIKERLNAVELFFKDIILTEELREILSGIYDMERLLSRISLKSANPRDLLAMKQSIKDFYGIKTLLKDLDSKELRDINSKLDDLSDIFKMIDETISEDAPVSLHDGDIIRAGFSEDCDRLREAAKNGRGLLLSLETKEREKTGIKNLKVKYNRVFGYYFEVTNSQLDMVPDYFIRRQTLAGSERFFTPELKELEDTILGAKEKLDRLEFELFSSCVEMISKNIIRIKTTAMQIARLDFYLSLAFVANKGRYVRPKLNKEGYINIKGGRHPVVESFLKDGSFINNDTYLDMGDNQIYLITGPNMAGKSTYMRQVALISLMAQMGSFVPADSADIGIADRIFTRVGASDDLSSGQSTFMVEMNEMANILKYATKDSLIVLDEIGRGTSTYDGLSIAWAVIEHIADKNKLGAKTLFATHYHELTSLPDKYSNVKNYSCAVKEQGDNIIFLRKIVNKAADKSYGIQVASLAGVPKSVTDRAGEILTEITGDNTESSVSVSVPLTPQTQMSIFDGDVQSREISKDLKAFNVNDATPLDALNFLNELKKKYGI